MRRWCSLSVWAGLALALSGALHAREVPAWQALIQAHAEQQALPPGARTELAFAPDQPGPPRCDQGLALLNPSPSVWRGRLRVSLQCPQPVWRWSVMVNVKRYSAVVRTRRALPSGSVVQPDDVQLVEVDLFLEPPGGATGLDQVLGLETSRSLREKSSISLNTLRQPTVIQAGDRISVRVLGSTFEVLSEGTALQSGATGDTIRVKMADGKPLNAEVVRRGEAAIRL